MLTDPSLNRIIYSPNPAVQQTIEALLRVGLAPIPVVPLQENGGYTPIHGKVPSYFVNSKAKLLAHQQLGLHDRLPTEEELKLWFSDPRIGIGTFGSSDGLTCWVDFDVKHFNNSRTECGLTVKKWREENSITDSWVDASGGGGFHVLVRFKEKPNFSKFALSPNGEHKGEILSHGQFCVLAPSIHPSGKPYICQYQGGIGYFDNAESARLYPVKSHSEVKPEIKSAEHKPTYQPTTSNGQWTQSDWAKSLLAALHPSRANDYDTWIKVGMALRSLNDPQLLGNWIEWSKQSSKFQPGECERRWGSFKAEGKITLGTLSYLAKQDGWVNPFKNVVSTPEEWKKQQAQKDWQRWIAWRKFTPTKEINQPYFSFGDVPAKGVVVAGKSGLGTGKTQELNVILNSSKKGSRLIGYRNNLLYQTAERLSQNGRTYYHLRRDESCGMLGDFNSHIAYCLDSIPRTYSQHYQDVDIILDETCSVLLHGINGGTLGSEQSYCLEVLRQALIECDRVFCLDGNLRDIDIDLIEKLSGKKAIRIENTYKPEPHHITFINAGNDDEEEVKKGARSPLVAALLGEDVRPWIITDSLKRSKVYDQLLREQKKAGYVLNSETSNEEWAREFLANPSTFIETYKPDYIILSPSGESGIDVHGNAWFTHKFSFFSGVLTTNSQTQIMFRLRDNIPHYVFCPEKGLPSDRNTPKTYNAEKFQELAEKFIQQSAELASEEFSDPSLFKSIFQKVLDKNNSDYWQYSCKLGAIDQFEIDHLRECLIYALKESGHIVEEVKWATDIAAKEKEKEATEQVIDNHAQAIYYAEDIDEFAAEDIRVKESNYEERIKLEKYDLLKRLPGIKDSQEWASEQKAKEFLKNCHLKNRNAISELERFWLVHHPEISAKSHFISWCYRASAKYFFNGGARKSHHSTVWALNQLDITTFFDEEAEWHKDSPEVIKLVERGKQPEIILALGIKPQKSNSDGSERIPYLKQLLNLCGLPLKAASRKGGKKNRTRTYKLMPECVYDSSRLTILDCIERKYREKNQEEEIEKALTAVDTQIAKECAENGTPPPASTPLLIYKNQGGVDAPLPDLPPPHSEPVLATPPLEVCEKSSEQNLTPTEQAIEAFKEVNSVGDFQKLIAQYPREVLEDAADMQDSAPARARARRMLEAVKPQSAALNSLEVAEAVRAAIANEEYRRIFYLNRDESVRLGWDNDQRRDCLMAKFGKTPLSRLDEQELLELYDYLKTLPTPDPSSSG